MEATLEATREAETGSQAGRTTAELPTRDVFGRLDWGKSGGMVRGGLVLRAPAEDPSFVENRAVTSPL